MKNVTYNMIVTISHICHISNLLRLRNGFSSKANTIKEISNKKFYHNTNTKKVSLVLGKRFKLINECEFFSLNEKILNTHHKVLYLKKC